MRSPILPFIFVKIAYQTLVTDMEVVLTVCMVTYAVAMLVIQEQIVITVRKVLL